MALGLESVYGGDDHQVGSDGLTKKERKLRQNSIAYDKMVDETALKQITTMDLADFNEQGRVAANSSNTNTIKSRNAAAALSGTNPSRYRALPASLSRARGASVFPSQNPTNTAHSAAVARSRTTLGYSRGRNVSTSLNQKAPSPSTTTTKLSPQIYMDIYGPPPLGSEMWIRCKTAGCFDDEANDSANGEELPTLGEGEEADNFQLVL